MRESVTLGIRWLWWSDLSISMTVLHCYAMRQKIIASLKSSEQC